MCAKLTIYSEFIILGRDVQDRCTESISMHITAITQANENGNRNCDLKLGDERN